MSRENVAESWEDADADPIKELMEKVEKVKLLQRKEEKKEAFFEKVKAEENGVITPILQTEDGLGPSVEEPKRVFLRRPKDGCAEADNAIESPPPSAALTENQSTHKSRPPQKSQQKEKQPAPTYEERQAAYQAARNRILGSGYKPDNQEIKEIKFIDRSKSPETLKMTKQNMVDHYGEELSRELMQQPVELVVPPEIQCVPDFTQPPPCMIPPTDGASVYNGPPGFQQVQPNLHSQVLHRQQPSQQQQQYFESQYYMQMNAQIPMQFQNSVQPMQQHFVPQESSAMSSSTSQNSNLDAHVDQALYFYPTPTHQQMFQNYMQYSLPNMSCPPPNFQPQMQQNPQVVSQINQSPMHQVQSSLLQQQQQNNSQIIPQHQMQNDVAGGNAPPNESVNNGGAGRGQNRQQSNYQKPGNGGLSIKPPPLMYPLHDKGHLNNGQSYPNKIGQGLGQQRQFQPQFNQNNSQFVHSQNTIQQNTNNGRKQQTNKNTKPGQNRNDNSVPRNQFQPVQPQMSTVQNPIPFGCPPRHVNAIREQYAGSMPPNTGAGILGPHPMMSASQWPTLQQNRPQ